MSWQQQQMMAGGARMGGPGPAGMYGHPGQRMAGQGAAMSGYPYDQRGGNYRGGYPGGQFPSSQQNIPQQYPGQPGMQGYPGSPHMKQQQQQFPSNYRQPQPTSQAGYPPGYAHGMPGPGPGPQYSNMPPNSRIPQPGQPAGPAPVSSQQSRSQSNPPPSHLAMSAGPAGMPNIGARLPPGSQGMPPGGPGMPGMVPGGPGMGAGADNMQKGQNMPPQGIQSGGASHPQPGQGMSQGGQKPDDHFSLQQQQQQQGGNMMGHHRGGGLPPPQQQQMSGHGMMGQPQPEEEQRD